MFLKILMMALSSNMTKKLIAEGFKKLLAHSSDGVTKDIAVIAMDSIAMSRANDAPVDAFDIIKQAL